MTWNLQNYSVPHSWFSTCGCLWDILANLIKPSPEHYKSLLNQYDFVLFLVIMNYILKKRKKEKARNKKNNFQSYYSLFMSLNLADVHSGSTVASGSLLSRTFNSRVFCCHVSLISWLVMRICFVLIWFNLDRLDIYSRR